MKTIAVFFADGFEDIEGLSPIDYLRRAKLNVITVGVTGIPYNNSMIVTSSHNVPIITDMNLDDYLKEYGNDLPDCVVCPGGAKGAQNLSNTKALLNHLEKCWEMGKFVSALCASPAVVLGKTNILDGKKWTCYPGMESEADKKYLENYSDKVFITDGKLVTGRGPGASEQFAMELVRILAGQEIFNQIHNGSLLR